MTMKKIYLISKSRHNTIFNKLDNKKYLLLILLLPVLFIAINSQNFFSVNAQSSLNNVIEQSQSNTQSSMQSNSNSNNGNCNNNISVQSQTTVNGKTTTTNKNTCGDNNSVSTSTSSNSIGGGTSSNPTLKGIIASVEYTPSGSVVMNSVFGNWSLTIQGDNSKDFKSSFIIQPINYNNLATSTSTPSNLNPQPKTFTNTTSYLLSNFIANSVAQQNSDITYVEKIDVVQNIHSSDSTQPDETNIFKGQDVSITILDDRVLVINFDKQSNLFDVFKNTPLVGLISSNAVK
jgi:hypothetical protein